MKKKLLSRLWAIGIFAFATCAYAIDAFVIQEIRVEGLQRVSTGVVFAALPIRVGDEIDDDISDQSIQALFKTGLFSDIQLERDGDTLVVYVVERPSIGTISISGNRRFNDEQIEQALQANEIAEGRVYNEQQVEKFIEGLKQEYISEGRFSADVKIGVEPQVRNRVNIAIEVFEGPRALIREIRFIGNETVSAEDLLDAMQLSTKKTWGMFNRRNRYSRTILDADVESIANYYLNQGYVDFMMNSTRTIIADNKEDIFIVFSLTEGPQYVFGETKIIADQQIVPQEELEGLIGYSEGDLFSRTLVSETRKAIVDRMANEGYALANVEAYPDIDRDTRKVDLEYAVDSGKLIHIRRIVILGNITTHDEVIRRELRVFEGGVYSAEKLLISRERLGRLGLFDSVDLRTEEVAGIPDQVDIVVDVAERLTGFLSFGVGYSEADRALVQLRLAQKNLFGSGKQISAEVTYGESSQDIAIDYLNPYYSDAGVSRGFHLEHRETDSLDVGVADYKEQILSGGVRFRYPISEEASFGIGFDANRYKFSRDSGQQTDYRIEEIIDNRPRNNIGKLNLSMTRDTRDRAVFATKGVDQEVRLELAGGDLSYYVLRTRHSQYFAVSDETTLKLTGQFDYGDSFGSGQNFPFFENFFAGGVSTVRGFAFHTLGPRELCRTNDVIANCENAEAVGGNKRVLLRSELFLPLFGTGESPDKRFSLFVDAGNVFGPEDNVEFSELRASAGLSFIWLSPIGPIGGSYALPLRKRDGDDLDRFQISLGTFLD